MNYLLIFLLLAWIGFGFVYINDPIGPEETPSIILLILSAPAIIIMGICTIPFLILAVIGFGIKFVFEEIKNKITKK